MFGRRIVSMLVASAHRTVVRGAAPWCRRFAARVGDFAHDRNGATMVYVGVVSVALMGVGAISIDVGQMVVLRNEMQNAADSACLGAAAQLNGTAGAQTRAAAVAQNIALDESGLASPDPVLSVENVQFYQYWKDPDVGTVAASGDHTANYVRVDLLAKDVDFLLAPAFQAVLGAGGGGSLSLDTYAVCRNAKLDCSRVPLLICSSTDPSDPASVLNPDNRGRMTVAKEGPGSVIPGAPGQFSLLCVDDGGTLRCGAKDLGVAMASDTGNFCNPDGLTTAPGSKTNQLAWGMDARFGEGAYTDEGPPAPNVVPYPRDPIYEPGGPGDTALMGGVVEAGSPTAYDQIDYVWDPKTYWNTYHPLEDPITGNQYYVQGDPDEPVGNPHFLYDGEPAPVICFDNAGVETCDNLATVVGGLGLPETIITTSTITAWAESYDPADGVTDPDPSLIEGAAQGGDGVLTRYKLYLYESYNNQPTNIPEDYDMSALATSARERRVTRVAVVDCLDAGVQGKTTITEGIWYLDVFVTEPVVPPPDATYYSEIIGNPLQGADYGAAQTEILNVQLVE